jgi:hypothetical protein
MPCILSKPLVWNDTNRSFTNARHNPIRCMPWEYPDYPLLRGMCYKNCIKVLRSMWYYLSTKEETDDDFINTKEVFMKSVKIVSGRRWLKNSNDRFVGCDKTHRKDIVNHFWVEFNGKKDHLVIDVGFQYGTEHGFLMMYSVPQYYKAFNIANRVEVNYTMDITNKKTPIEIEIPPSCWNDDY